MHPESGGNVWQMWNRRIGQDHNKICASYLDAQEYNSLLETLYLLSNPSNANRLHEGISQHRKDLVREIDVTAYLD